MPTYLGPAVTFEYKGKTYRPDQNIPLNDAELLDAQMRGHRFEGAPAQSAEPTVSTAVGAAPEAEDAPKTSKE